MIELRFHEELYDGFAVDEAAKAYAEHGSLELVRDPGGYVIKVTVKPETAAQGITEAALCLEIANYALGRTVDRRGAAAPLSAGGAP